MADPYETLGVARNASQDEIRKAYRKAAKATHPDLNPGKPEAEKRFKEINAANDIIGDVDKRKRYDAGEIDDTGTERQPERHFYREYAEADPNMRYRRRPESPAGQRGGPSDPDLDIFADLFSGRGQGGHFRMPPQDVRYALEIDFLDAVNGANALDKHAEAVRQAAVADAILVTKSDIAPSSATTALMQRLAQLNPTADIRAVVQGNIAPDAIFFRGLSVNEARHNLPVCEHAHDHAHDSRIRTFTLTFEAPVDPVTLQRLMAAIEQLKGPSLLRVKGIVHPQDGSGPLVIHAVQDVVHPLTRLARPIEAGPSRVVFITWDVPRERLDQLMRQLAE